MRNNLFNEGHKNTDSGKVAWTVEAFSNALLVSMAKGEEPRGRRTDTPQLRNQIFLEIWSSLKEVTGPRDGCTYYMDVWILQGRHLFQDFTQLEVSSNIYLIPTQIYGKLSKIKIPFSCSIIHFQNPPVTGSVRFTLFNLFGIAGLHDK